MPTPVHGNIAKRHQFRIGRDQRRSGGGVVIPTDALALTTTLEFDPLVGIIERVAYVGANPAAPAFHPAELFCMVQNYGTTEFELQITESSDLAEADAFAARGYRIDGADVGTGLLTVVPGGKAVFTIEWASGDEAYIRFNVDVPAFGDLSITNHAGTILFYDHPFEPSSP